MKKRYAVQRGFLEHGRVSLYVTVHRCWTERGARKVWWDSLHKVQGGFLPYWRIYDTKTGEVLAP